MTSICKYLEELANRETRLILYPADRLVEGRMNWWAVSRGSDDSPANLEVIEERLRNLAKAWTEPDRAVNLSEVNQATFYAWYDAQSGTLNVCLTSAASPRGQFGGGIACVDEPRPIVQQLLRDPHPGTIFMDELSDVTPGDRETITPPAGLAVWAVTNRW